MDFSIGSSGSQSGGNVDVADDSSAEDAGRAMMEQLLADPSHEYRSPQFGDVIDGTLMRVDRDELLVDIGSKSEGVIPAREFSSLSESERQDLQVGNTVLVFVTQPENQDGVAIVSIDRARQEKSWRVLQQTADDNEVIEAEVVNYNKGGLLVNLDGVRGFVPASQVTEISGGDDAQKQADMARLIGRKLNLKIIEINRHRNRLILSERQALQERRDEMKEKLIEELTEGEVRRGRVSSICDFGAFVDVGGADGLVHLSELSWSRVRHPSEMLQIGQEVDVYVLGINAEERKIALSIKRTQPEPWSWVATKYDVNQLVVGRVTQLANFGAFARIEDGIEGLVHVSELSEARISHPRQYVSEGQDLLLRIIRIDPQRRRMGLSLRRGIDATDEEVLEALGAEAVELKNRLLEMEIEPDPDAPAQDSYSAAASEAAPEADTTDEVVAELPEATEAPEEQLSGTMADQLASLSEELGAAEEQEVDDAPADEPETEAPVAEVEETVVEAEPTIDAAVQEAETRLEAETATTEEVADDVATPET
ncbi:MAG: S1 RNA-binding domain-containing protein, partial [Chloroflexia bacterium]|nr:S1 RNA-binding domain-containing protein [Chloroflexia bacterium]